MLQSELLLLQEFAPPLHLIEQGVVPVHPVEDVATEAFMGHLWRRRRRREGGRTKKPLSCTPLTQGEEAPLWGPFLRMLGYPRLGEASA